MLETVPLKMMRNDGVNEERERRHGWEWEEEEEEEMRDYGGRRWRGTAGMETVKPKGRRKKRMGGELLLMCRAHAGV